MESIVINCASEGTPYQKHWQYCVGAGRANEGMRADWRMHLKEAVTHCGFKYLRFHGLLHDDMIIYHEKADGSPIYNWQYVDDLFDYMLELGIRPFVEFGFMPSHLASGNMTVFWWKGNVTPPKDINKWGGLIGNCIKHWIDRYGLNDVRSWYFEVWNEANLKDCFWSGTQDDYFRLYDATAKAVKAVDDRLRIGGPATSSFIDGEAPWVKELIKFCANNNLPVDFISTHPYPVRHPVDELTGEYLDEFREESSTYDDLTWLKKTVASSRFPKAEIHLTEWNSSPSPRDYVHDHPFAGVFIIKNNIECIGLCDSLSYWVFTDVFEEQRAGDTPFHGGFGLINMQGIYKPAYYAYTFLCKLGSNILGKGDGWLATKDEDGNIQIIVWNYKHYINPDGRLAKDKDSVEQLFGDGEKRKFNFQLDGLEKGNHKVKIRTIDGANNSAFHAWKAMGSPGWLTKEQVIHLKSRGEPAIQNLEVNVDGTMLLPVILEPYGYALVEINAKE